MAKLDPKFQDTVQVVTFVRFGLLGKLLILLGCKLKITAVSQVTPSVNGLFLKAQTQRTLQYVKPWWIPCLNPKPRRQNDS